MKIEKVDINIPNKVPIYRDQSCKPIKFKLSPQPGVHWSENVEEIKWNCVKQTLKLEISETAQFDVYQWIKQINRNYEELQKNSFANLQKEHLVLYFSDQHNKLVAGIKIWNFNVENHRCKMTQDFEDYMNHCITIRYRNSEMITFDEINADSQENIDSEWQTSNEIDE